MNKTTSKKTLNQPSHNVLSYNVTYVLENYFTMLGDEVPTDVFQMVITQVEKPMIEFVLHKTDFNKTKASQMLGINRNTLRKKIQQYNIQ